MNSTLKSSMKTASKTMDEAKETAGKTAHRASSAIADGLHAAASALAALRSLGIVDALGWVGLQRRRSSATPFVAFGAGLLAGAAAGILLAPLSGAEMRRAIVERATKLGSKAEAEVAVAREKVAEAIDMDRKPSNGVPKQPTHHT